MSKDLKFSKKVESIFIRSDAIHRIQNLSKKKIKIIGTKIGSILRENDIIRYQNIYGKIK